MWLDARTVMLLHRMCPWRTTEASLHYHEWGRTFNSTTHRRRPWRTVDGEGTFNSATPEAALHCYCWDCGSTPRWGMFSAWCQAKDGSYCQKETENTLPAAREYLECCKMQRKCWLCQKEWKGKGVLLCEEFQGQANRPKPLMRLTCKTGSQHFGDLNKNLCKGSMWS